ncbi:hypothetical protein BJ165DRAFT_1527126 [Panaeolus papilionaceus]|nr:hypothetical protein BJ165DRAFT_1527126 [Panaeolus papilionaceus]
MTDNLHITMEDRLPAVNLKHNMIDANSPDCSSPSSSESSDDDYDRSAADTPNTELASPSSSPTPPEACSCSWSGTCAFCGLTFDKVYCIVREDLQSPSNSILPIKHLLPSKTTLYNAPELVNTVVDEMLKIVSNRNLLNATKNDLIRKAFKFLYQIYAFFAGDEVDKSGAGVGHPSTLLESEGEELKNVVALFQHIPTILDIYATHVHEAHGQTNAKFIRLTHWYLYRGMKSVITIASEDRRGPDALSNAVVTRAIKFFIQHPNYMILDTAFCLSVFIQCGSKSTIYPTSLFSSRPKIGEAYRRHISTSFTKESIFSSLGMAMKENRDLTGESSRITTELHLNVIISAMQLFWEGVDRFPETSACREMAETVAGALIGGGKGAEGTRDKFKERIVQVFDRIVTCCVKRLTQMERSVLAQICLLGHREPRFLGAHPSTILGSRSGSGFGFQSSPLPSPTTTTSYLNGLATARRKTKGLTLTKLMWKLLPLFTTEGAMEAYIYHGWGTPFNFISGKPLMPGTTTPPLITAYTTYLTIHTPKLCTQITNEPIQELPIKINRVNAILVAALAVGKELYSILDALVQHGDRLVTEAAAAYDVVIGRYPDEERIEVYVVGEIQKMLGLLDFAGEEENSSVTAE